MGALVNKVIAQASTRPGDTQPDQITAAELAELGITAPIGSLTDAANAPALRAALYLIRFGDDKGIEVDTMAELQEVVSKAMTAYKKIQTYAALNDIPAGFPNDADRPNADDFEAMGLVAPPSVKADLAVGAAASLATAHIGLADIDTPEKLLTLLQNWDTLTGDGSKQVWMRQTDVAGNVAVSDRFDFTLDTVANAPSVRLVNDTGNTALLPGADTDKITRDGTVEVLGLEPGATWQYKFDDGNWQNGSLTTFTLGGSEGAKRMVVRQTDKAGNASAESAPLEFKGCFRISPFMPYHDLPMSLP